MSRSATSTGVVRSAREQLLAAGGLGDDLDVGLGVEQRTEARADELVVVGERDADHGSTRQGSRAHDLGAAAFA